MYHQRRRKAVTRKIRMFLCSLLALASLICTTILVLWDCNIWAFLLLVLTVFLVLTGLGIGVDVKGKVEISSDKE